MSNAVSRFLTIAIVSGAIAMGPVPIVSAQETEQPNFSLLIQEGPIEVRKYTPMIVAQVTVSGERRRAMSGGFRLIADYIFGNNISSNKIAMTSPVTQKTSEKIAMTSPVTQQENADDIWQVRFIMPSEYSMETLPRPVNSAVQLLEIPAQSFAVIRFSGTANNGDLAAQTDVLRRYMASNGMEAAGAPTYAFYDGPWTRPANRRNEVMVRLAD